MNSLVTQAGSIPPVRPQRGEVVPMIALEMKIQRRLIFTPAPGAPDQDHQDLRRT
jgi:hypothetical protein